MVADSKSFATEDLVSFEYRVPNADGEFLTEASLLRAGDVKRQKWYWLPEQTPDEVLVIKLADSESGAIGKPGGSVAGSTPHGSPLLPGTEDKPTRESIEVRVIAVW